jgi:arylsulfatase A-like enzyme
LGEGEFNNLRARYAASVVLTDRWLGVLLDKMDELSLWDDTAVIFTTDHGTFNGDFGRMGKMQTHEFASKSHIPFIFYHPDFAHGERRSQLVQTVDIYPTVLNILGRPVPSDRHGIDLTRVLADGAEATRPYAISGTFGQSVSITDGRWTLHQPPVPDNGPLYWYDYCLAKFLYYDLGPYINGRREVRGCPVNDGEAWLSDRGADFSESQNLVGTHPEKLLEMRKILKDMLIRMDAPPEQLDRLGLRYI